MSRCILHYGMPKTGSSSIQTWLLRELADPRYRYLNLGTRGSGNLMVTAFMENPAEHHHNVKRGLDATRAEAESETIRASIARQIGELEHRTALFSAELLANTKAEAVRAVVDFLRPQVDSIEAVGYVRAPVSFMESVFQQQLKSGRTEFTPARMYPGYRRRLAIFESLLGRDRVQHWPFAPRSFVRGCIVRDFCTRLGIEIGEEDVRRVNDSLSLDAIRLLWAYRRFGPGYGTGDRALRENQALIRTLITLAGPKMRLHADLVAPLLAERRADIEWMEERLDASLAEQPSSEPDCIREEADLVRFSRASLDWLAAQKGVRRLRKNPTPEQVARAMHAVRLHAVPPPPAPVAIWQRLQRRFGRA